MPFWTTEMAEAVADLIRNELPTDQFGAQALSVGAYPVGWGLWNYCFLRPSGEVVLIDQEFEPGAITVDGSRGAVLSAFVDLSKEHPKLARLLPARVENATDCPKDFHEFISHKMTCPLCGGMGWLPPQEQR